MRQISREEVEMTFESSGMPPIIQEFVQRVYLPNGNILMYCDGIYREFVLKTMLRKLNAEGAKMYEDDTIVRTALERMKIFEANLRENIDLILNNSNVTWEDFTKLTRSADEYIAQYNAFDTWYTDGAYPHISDPKVAQALDVALKEKNVIRVTFSELFFEQGKNFLKALAHVGAQHGVNESDIIWYFTSDLASVFSGVLLSEQTLTARRQSYVSFKNETGEFEWLEGGEARAYIEKFDESALKSEEMKGTSVAKKVIVRGTVRVISSDYVDFSRTQRAMDAMQKGDILVSPTTAPDLMPALNKASAIVTDVGGMLSHAAIVARELNIPCIVGVRDASKLLKDGDMVEVDANNGIVKKVY